MWSNPNYGKKLFKGYYEYDADGERVFVLMREDGKRKVTYESFQAAKRLGWERV